MKYKAVLDRKYALLAKIQTVGDDFEGNYVIAKSDDYLKLVSIAESIESAEVLTNLIIIETDSKDLLWKSKNCVLPSNQNYGSDLTRWLVGDYAFPFPAL